MATKANLIIDAGTDFSTTITITNDTTDAVVDLTGYTGRAQIRKHFASSNSVNFDVTVGGVEGSVTLSLSDTQTSAMRAGRYVYDVEVVSADNVVSRIVEGIVTITPNVTR